MSFRLVLHWTILAAVLVTSGERSLAAVEYRIEQLGPYRPMALNDKGQIIASSNDPNKPDSYFYDGHRWTDLTTTYGVHGTPLGLSNTGEIVGSTPIEPGINPVWHAYSLNNGVFKDLGSTGHYSDALSVNSSGRIVGISNLNSDESGPSQAASFDNGTVNLLGTLGGQTSWATHINEQGVIVGQALTKGDVQHAAIFDQGRVIDLGTLGGTTSSGRSISDNGLVVGYSSTGKKLPDGRSVNDAFLYQDGKMIDLGHGIINGRAWDTEASLVNDLGEIIGSVSGTDVIYEDGQFTPLQDLIDPKLHLTIEFAVGLNNSGTILVQGLGPDNNSYVYLLHPVPEPASAGLLGLGAIGLLLSRRAGRK